MKFSFNFLLSGSGFAAIAVATVAVPASAKETETTVGSDIVVTEQRTTRDITPPTHQITTLEREDVESARAASDTLSTILAKAVPGLADSSRTITDYGQTLPDHGARLGR